MIYKQFAKLVVLTESVCHTDGQTCMYSVHRRTDMYVLCTQTDRHVCTLYTDGQTCMYSVHRRTDMSVSSGDNRSSRFVRTNGPKNDANKEG